MMFRLRNPAKLWPEPKLFFIGFNKCGTTSFHKFFRLNGYNSVHSRTRVLPFFQRRNIPFHWADNVAAGRNPLRGMQHCRVFSGISHAKDDRFVEGNSFFRELHQHYPDAFFVFNRRPVENWIKSRFNHRDGRLRKRHAEIRGVPEAALPDLWRADFTEREAEILAYFADNPRFMVFNLESDPVSRLIAFLAPSFTLDERHWAHRNKSPK
jgi:hypothetical protein